MKMNTSYEELDADIEQQLPKEEHKWEERCETCNRSCKRFIQEKSTPLKWLFIFVVSMSMICLYVTYFIELIECRTDGYCKYHEQHDYYLKENYNKTKHRRLTVAGRLHYNRRHHKTCDDYEFGCCEIYTDCKYNETAFTSYHTYTFHSLPKHDKKGTNCPRLLDLVNGHNHHYPLPDDKNCEDSEKGCYKIETECDIRIRYMDTDDETHDINRYKKNIKAGIAYTNLVDRVGIEYKPSIMGLMYDYINKYPEKGVDGSGIILGFLLLAVVAMCSSACHKSY